MARLTHRLPRAVHRRRSPPAIVGVVLLSHRIRVSLSTHGTGELSGLLEGRACLDQEVLLCFAPDIRRELDRLGLGVVPTEFDALVKGLPLDSALQAEIDKLIEAKRAGAELDYGPRIVPINNYIESELSRFSGMTFDYDKRVVRIDQLDFLFRSALKEVWT